MQFYVHMWIILSYVYRVHLRDNKVIEKDIF